VAEAACRLFLIQTRNLALRPRGTQTRRAHVALAWHGGREKQRNEEVNRMQHIRLGPTSRASQEMRRGVMMVLGASQHAIRHEPPAKASARRKSDGGERRADERSACQLFARASPAATPGCRPRTTPHHAHSCDDSSSYRDPIDCACCRPRRLLPTSLRSALLCPALAL
jgi:hypothetical protein